MKKQNLINVGTFDIRFHHVELFANPSEIGGDFRFGGPNKRPRITVGINYKDWDSVLHVLLHEIAELIMTGRNLRASYDQHISNPADYFFLMDHQQFDHVCVDIAIFLAYAEPKLKLAWQKNKPNP